MDIYHYVNFSLQMMLASQSFGEAVVRRFKVMMLNQLLFNGDSMLCGHRATTCIVFLLASLADKVLPNL